MDNEARIEELYRLGNHLIPSGTSDGSPLGEYLEKRIKELKDEQD